MRVLSFLAVLAVAAGILVAQPSKPSLAVGEGHTEPLMSFDWPFGGVFGVFDNAQLRRGAQVYYEVCAGCHTLRQVMDLGRARTLAQIGAEAEQIQNWAQSYSDNAGAREGQAQLNPPDLSLMAKARAGGPDYIASLLLGYREEVPEDVELEPGQYYNVYFDGNKIAMAPPLTEGRVSYEGEGAPEATVSQMSQDVAAFLMWTAEPKLTDRKQLGIRVILFLLVLSILFYAIKRKVWARIEH
jgi:ubiquinol-cytochrome c reductase cytochrome c1 subunit